LPPAAVAATMKGYHRLESQASRSKILSCDRSQNHDLL
jgi:hypothetical protein